MRPLLIFMDQSASPVISMVASSHLRIGSEETRAKSIKGGSANLIRVQDYGIRKRRDFKIGKRDNGKSSACARYF